MPNRAFESNTSPLTKDLQIIHEAGSLALNVREDAVEHVSAALLSYTHSYMVPQPVTAFITVEIEPQDDEQFSAYIFEPDFVTRALRNYYDLTRGDVRGQAGRLYSQIQLAESARQEHIASLPATANKTRLVEEQVAQLIAQAIN